MCVSVPLKNSNCMFGFGEITIREQALLVRLYLFTITLQWIRYIFKIFKRVLMKASAGINQKLKFMKFMQQ